MKNEVKLRNLTEEEDVVEVIKSKMLRMNCPCLEGRTANGS